MDSPIERRNLIIGTAGHIDHGKTVLVKALTGRDTDRLAEEKERGISIDLGFAPLRLSDGSIVGIVDVPGHENFIRNMMAGATGVDLALLVVAADDGVMPQTREHLAILDLLGVKKAVVAITKIDTVDSELLPLVEDEIKDLLKGTPLEGSAVLRVSAVTGEGIEQLRSVLENEASRVSLKSENLPARLPIDRVFTLRGIGTVVTGTLWSGAISPGQRLEVQPRGSEARVRAVQVHDVEREKAFAGERVAVNLAGVSRDQVARGDVLAEPGYIRPTYMLDARARILRDWAKPVRRGARVRFHHGTREVLARIYPLDGQQLKPGESKAVQLRLEEQVVVAPGDRFVIRSYSPVTTIGGGGVIDSHASKHKLSDPTAIKQFEELESGDAARMTLVHLDRAKKPVTDASLVLASGLPPETVREGLKGLLTEGRTVAVGEKSAPLYISTANFEAVKGDMLQALERFHKEKPLAEGMAKETLKAQVLTSWDARTADVFMEALAHDGVIQIEGKLVRLPGAKAAVTSDQQRLLDEVIERVRVNPVSPPTVSELATELGQTRKALGELLALAEADGRLLRVSPELYFSPEAVSQIEARLRESMTPEGITVGDFRNVIGTSRKYALPLLEYFDRNRITARVGDVRKLR